MGDSRKRKSKVRFKREFKGPKGKSRGGNFNFCSKSPFLQKNLFDYVVHIFPLGGGCTEKFSV